MFIEQEKGKYILETKSYNQLSEIPSGIYGVSFIGGFLSPSKPFFSKHTLSSEILRFKSGPIGEVIDKIDLFFSEEVINKYKLVNLRHKEGVILFGKTGTGKTKAIQIAMQLIADKHDVLCLDFSEHPSYELFQMT